MMTWIVVVLFVHMVLQCALSPAFATAWYIPQHVDRRIAPKVFIFGMVSYIAFGSTLAYSPRLRSLPMRGRHGLASQSSTSLRKTLRFPASHHYFHKPIAQKTSRSVRLPQARLRSMPHPRSQLLFTLLSSISSAHTSSSPALLALIPKSAL